MTPLQNLMIIASAGCGKTHRLTSRYIELLARGAEPSRILALTFTTAAAAEFLDAILERLVEAAEDAEALDELRRQTKMDSLTREDVLRMLRMVVSQFGRLTLGTMDAFFLRIVRCFPGECGLPADPVILDDHHGAIARAAVLRGLYLESGASRSEQREFLYLIRQQSRQQDGRAVAEVLDRTVAEFHEAFLRTPPDRPWGDPRVVWPDSSLPKNPPDPRPVARALQEFVWAAFPDMQEAQRLKWEEFFAGVEALVPGGLLPAAVAGLAAKMLAPKPSKKNPGQVAIVVQRVNFDFDAHGETLLRETAEAIRLWELHGKLEASRAMFSFLEKYEQRYHQLVRGTGRLTFQDVTALLAGYPAHGQTRPAFDRQLIDYRMDSRFDHWLLDEFQDTNRTQWSALANLVDEVLQSPPGERSLFYVGDTKQAVYGWRGGDPKLFYSVFDYYNRGREPRIETGDPLHKSYRSAAPILDAVNAVFGKLPAHAEELELPVDTIERWERAWQEHEPARNLSGCVVWHDVAKGEVAARTVEILRELDPAGRGWECAVLVQKNDFIPGIVEALRREGIPATGETLLNPCADNRAAGALLAAFQLLAHPGDTFAFHELQMGSLRVLVDEGLDAFVDRELARLTRVGFEATAREWMRRSGLADQAAEEPFLANRLDHFLTGAAEFDASGDRGVGLFLDFMRARELRDAPMPGTVRVLTIHRSKGLGFDAVVLPQLGGNKFTTLRNKRIFLHEEEGRVAWGLDLPSEALSAGDPVLEAARAEARADGAYEALCKFYVAFTRAKRGLYLVTEEASKPSTSNNFIKLLRLTMPVTAKDGEPGVHGDPDWHAQGNAEVPAAVEQTPAPAAWAGKLPAEPPEPLRPSSAEKTTGRARLAATTQRALGAELHKLFAAIEWLDGESADEVAVPDGTSAEAAALFQACLRGEAVRECFRRPAPDAVVWRERAFDVLLDGQWITGVFDRVVIHATKTPRVLLVDFKTEDAPPEELRKRHAPQLAHYRRALAALLGIPEKAVRPVLVAVRPAEVVALD